MEIVGWECGLVAVRPVKYGDGDGEEERVMDDNERRKTGDKRLEMTGSETCVAEVLG